MVTSLARREEAFTGEELVAWLRRRVGDDLLDVVDEHETATFVLAPSRWVDVARMLKEEPRLAFSMFDCLFAVDAGEGGFDVVTILYSVETGLRAVLRCRAEGGRETPTLPTLTGLYAGADWHEREAFDMFGIDFEGHRGLLPRLLTAENFEGWPLRKDFHLATREAKPWPGIKEPAELDEDGNIIERVPGIGEAVGPMPLDELMAEQARTANPDLVAAQETGDDEDGEDAEGAALADGDVPPGAVGGERADGHADITAHGASDSEAVQAQVRDADPALRDADEVRAEAAEARARRAEAIAAGGVVGGGGNGPVVPAGDPTAFDITGEVPPHRGPTQADTGGNVAVPDSRTEQLDADDPEITRVKPQDDPDAGGDPEDAPTDEPVGDAGVDDAQGRGDTTDEQRSGDERQGDAGEDDDTEENA